MKTTKMVVIIVLVLGLAAEVANADFFFCTPTNLGPIVNSSYNDASPDISADGLSLFFQSDRPGGSGEWDLWVARRETKDDDWGTPVNLGLTVNSSTSDQTPHISGDGLSLYFFSIKPGGSGWADLWVTTRATTADDWGNAVNLGPTVNSATLDSDPSISADGLVLYFCSDRPGGSGGADLWVVTRSTIDDDWGAPVNLGPIINTSFVDTHPRISADGLALFFASDRPGGYGSWDLYVTTRLTVSDPWGTPVNLGPMVNTAYGDSAPGISPNGLLLYFSDYPLPRPGGYGDLDIWQVPIEPVVDLNGDGIVDCADMCIMVDHWGTDNPLCDIGPTPFGDGIVDVQDLIVLAEHLFEEVDDPTLFAQWALDEIEGNIAYDSANDNDGAVYGDPAWQTEGGMVNGALQLDGIDDYVSTPFVLNPADGKFSVFIWIKGGAPGQVVLSQIGGARWLCTDSLEGNLMTELKSSGRGAVELLSQTNITDGNWHRIGLVWDGSHRTLYVDDIAVAEDAQTNLEGSENGLYIGTGKAMEPGSFWSGLIDDVRIYNRPVSP